MEKMLATMTTKPNYESEIIKIVKGNGSPKVILNQLENYHGSDIADVMEGTYEYSVEQNVLTLTDSEYGSQKTFEKSGK